MSLSRALPFVFALVASACSSGAFDVAGSADDGAVTGDSSASDSSVVDTALPADTSVPVDTAVALDASAPDALVADAPKVDAVHPDVVVTPDVGCALGATQPCECGGTRTCRVGGAWSACEMRCPVAPARYFCAFGKNGCTYADCIDTNNCGAQCDCKNHPGIVCTYGDPCWAAACEGYACP